MSINCHNKLLLSRRDDLISLSYTIIYLIYKNLPWLNLYHDDINKFHNLIKKNKREFNNNIDNYKLSEPILFFYKYCNNLKYKEKPNYDFLINSFLFNLKNKKYKYDIIWSWN